jgi:hypothetical protein
MIFNDKLRKEIKIGDILVHHIGPSTVIAMVSGFTEQTIKAWEIWEMPAPNGITRIRLFKLYIKRPQRSVIIPFNILPTDMQSAFIEKWEEEEYARMQNL